MNLQGGSKNGVPDRGPGTPESEEKKRGRLLLLAGFLEQEGLLSAQEACRLAARIRERRG